jgi:paxillin
VTAAGARFHPACFRCVRCAEHLECVAFYPEPEEARAKRVAEEGALDWDLRFYCHLDFHELFSPRCRSCKTPIEGEVVVACGAEWHAGHFFCAQCGDVRGPEILAVDADHV